MFARFENGWGPFCAISSKHLLKVAQPCAQLFGAPRRKSKRADLFVPLCVCPQRQRSAETFCPPSGHVTQGCFAVMKRCPSPSRIFTPSLLCSIASAEKGGKHSRFLPVETLWLIYDKKKGSNLEQRPTEGTTACEFADRASVCPESDVFFFTFFNSYSFG